MQYACATLRIHRYIHCLRKDVCKHLLCGTAHFTDMHVCVSTLVQSTCVFKQVLIAPMYSNSSSYW